MRNSTIITKKRQLDCGCYGFAFSKNKCKMHSNADSFNKRMEKETSKFIQEDDLSDLIKDADALVSQFVRLSAADENGLCKCYTCSTILPWNKIDAGHYVSRGTLLLRFDVSRNIRCQCVECNRFKHGNLAVYAQNLDRDFPGLPDILMEEAAIVYKPSKSELKQLMGEYSLKVKELKKKLNQ